MPTPNPSRVLAAVVFTDVVSFTARMAQDESKTIALVRRDLTGSA